MLDDASIDIFSYISIGCCNFFPGFSHNLIAQISTIDFSAIFAYDILNGLNELLNLSVLFLLLFGLALYMLNKKYTTF